MSSAPDLNRLPAILAALAVGCCASASAATLVENFDSANLPGWTVINHSEPIGTIDWFQGDTLRFSAQGGAAGSYAAADFRSGAGVANISDWLITPTLNFNNGDTLNFYTRTVSGSLFPDRLEVRFSAVGGTDVGVGAASVGSFSALLLSVNPNLSVGGYPANYWKSYSYTFSNLAGATNGAIGFRYFVSDGGDGSNSNYIGLDTVSITAAVPEPSSWLMLAFGLGALGMLRARHSRSAETARMGTDRLGTGCAGQRV